MKYNQKLPKEVEEKLDEYIERIKKIQWFKPSKNLKKSKVDKLAKFAIKTFGIEASIEYRSLKDPNAAWNAAWDATKDAAWGAAKTTAKNAAWNATGDAAWGASWNAVKTTAEDAAENVAWNAARDAAEDAAWGAADMLALNLDDYKKKYPDGNFINLIPLWELGLYPIGIIDGKFIIYVPPTKEVKEFPQDLITKTL